MKRFVFALCHRLIAMLFGVTDISLLISIAIANATMNLLGLMMEWVEKLLKTLMRIG